MESKRKEGLNKPDERAPTKHRRSGDLVLSAVMLAIGALLMVEAVTKYTTNATTALDPSNPIFEFLVGFVSAAVGAGGLMPGVGISSLLGEFFKT